MTAATAVDRVVIPATGLAQLLEVLRGAGYTVLGPVVRDAAIVIDEITEVDDLPRGWGDVQDGGTYRLVPRGDDAYFGFAAPAGTWKRHLFPPRSVLWRSTLVDGEPVIDEVVEAPTRRAFLGVRGCDLAAIAVQDRVFRGVAHPDPVYAARREGLLLIGVSCGDPASTCFCTSMGTGPGAEAGGDLTLTELDPGDPTRHRFLVEPWTEHGREVVRELAAQPAPDDDLTAARTLVEGAADRITRSLDTDGLRETLREAPSHPRWDDVAARCLACGNCTMACPTCFCSDVSDQPSVLTGQDERVRVWASCFELGHSYLHGGAVRVSGQARYRQWMTHKLSTWWDQFDMSGCVGCGRCIAWCPVGIDITAEATAIAAAPHAVR
jgi:sulfhydrogenase subunit beta (sulfur reductase)